jgi:hypothetical protein
MKRITPLLVLVIALLIIVTLMPRVANAQGVIKVTQVYTFQLNGEITDNT